MCMIVRKFYPIAVEDLKPIIWQDLAQSFDPDELVYLVSVEGENVVLADVRVCNDPDASECAE